MKNKLIENPKDLIMLNKLILNTINWINEENIYNINNVNIYSINNDTNDNRCKILLSLLTRICNFDKMYIEDDRKNIKIEIGNIFIIIIIYANNNKINLLDIISKLYYTNYMESEVMVNYDINIIKNDIYKLLISLPETPHIDELNTNLFFSIFLILLSVIKTTHKFRTLFQYDNKSLKTWKKENKK